jgi:hypothetical protein
LALQEVGIETIGERVTISTAVEQGDECLSHQLHVNIWLNLSTLYCTTDDLLPYLLFTGAIAVGRGT